MAPYKPGSNELRCTPDADHVEFDALRALFPELVFRVQQGNSLGDRMAKAGREGLEKASGVIIIGTDCPGVDADLLREAGSLLGLEHQAVLGPAADGGYYLIGFRQFHARVFEDVAWGTRTVARQTRERMTEIDWNWVELLEKIDVDHVKDLKYYPEVVASIGHPESRTPRF